MPPRDRLGPDDLLHLPRAGNAYPLDEQTLRVRLRARRGTLTSCLVQWGDRYAPREEDRQQPMERWARDSRYEYWQAALPRPSRRVHYLFRVGDGIRQYWYGEEGLSLDEPGTFMTSGYFHWPFIHPGDIFDTPIWAREAVVYQIFVDRFLNGDSGNDPPGTVSWGTPPTATMRAGGDLQGIIDGLEYLQDLGITAIYLTPIFLANTNHKYDTIDYRRIDPSFGDDRTLRRLIDRAHARGIRVILDAVFNHSGRDFGPWRDVARHQEHSPYRDWFHIRAFPVDPDASEAEATFEHFGNHPALPKLNTAHSAVREYLLGVAAHWTRFGITGWRLDAANEVDHAFWQALHRTVRAINPDAVLVGEIWHEATQFVRPGEFDGLTHYPFWAACRSFFALGAIDAQGFNDRLTRARVPYREQAVLWNVLSTHDTPFFLTDCGGDARRIALALIVQMTYPGVPHIYYGDEVGLAGGTDPGSRACMEWDPNRQHGGLRELVRRLIALRHAHPALRGGSYAVVRAEPGRRLFAYTRQAQEDRVLVAVQAGRRPATLTVPAEMLGTAIDWRDGLDGTRYAVEGGVLTVPLSPWRGVVLYQV